MKSVFELDDENAVNHIYRVGLGLESKIPGDVQILNQVKKAYQISIDTQLAGAYIHRLLHGIFYAHKRVVSETGFHDGKASLSSAAAELAKIYAAEIHNPVIALLGMGEIGSSVAENFKDYRGEILLSNRSFEKASKLAYQLGFKAVPFEKLDETLQKADIVISAVSTNKPIINKKKLQNLSFYHKVFIDLSVPRSIDPDIEELSNTSLYNVDQLECRIEEAQQNRMAAIPQVELILKESMNEFLYWNSSLSVRPVIGQLKQVLVNLQQQELAKLQGKLNTAEWAWLEQITGNMISKFLKYPALSLKTACERGNADQLSDALRELFDLEFNQ